MKNSLFSFQYIQKRTHDKKNYHLLIDKMLSQVQSGRSKVKMDGPWV